MCWVVTMVRRRVQERESVRRLVLHARSRSFAPAPLSPCPPPKKQHQQLITTLYYVLSLATAHNLIRSYRQLDIPISNEIWRAPVAAAVLGGLLTLLCNVLSCAVLAKKTSDKRGGGFGFGFIAAMCASLAFFALLCGLVLDGFKDVVRSELQVKREFAFCFCLRVLRPPPLARSLRGARAPLTFFSAKLNAASLRTSWRMSLASQRGESLRSADPDGCGFEP
jgi:hypothetical protein